MSDELYKSALQYHRVPTPGKLSMVATKPMANQRDLSLAYSPGVAAACLAIDENPAEAATLTNRANLVAVITNGTAVLGLGNIGPLAAKPVMEGKSVLFKKFAGIDSYDVGITETDPDKLVEIIASLEPSFGAINLEDIKAPECFEIEQKLKERMKIPVFHDDQHGTAIIASAAFLNGLELAGKKIEDVRIVTSGAGAAAMACLDLFISLGVKLENIVVTDREGVVHKGRQDVSGGKARFAHDHPWRSLGDAMKEADVFLGLSAGNILNEEMVMSMAKNPLIFALANPTPEVDPQKAAQWRPDAIIATGRSDYPNQVNNVLCFPFIFRGALDVGATQINDHMKLACVKALAALAKAESSEDVDKAYGETSGFGPNYIIPKPFDSRLIAHLAPAVAKAAMESGVATRPIEDFDAYAQDLTSIVYRTGMAMRQLFTHAKANPKTICFSEGEDKRVLRAAQIVVDEGYAKTVLVGRPDVIAYRLNSLGLRLKIDQDILVVDPQDDPRFKSYWKLYYELMQRKGVSPDLARVRVRSINTIIGALMLKRHEVDGLIAGPAHHYDSHVTHLKDVIGLQDGIDDLSSLNGLVVDQGIFFFMDAYIHNHPDVAHCAEAVIRASKKLQYFNLQPKIALLSRSTFGSHESPASSYMQKLRSIISEKEPDLMVDGEMDGEAAIDPDVRGRIFPDSSLTGMANLFVMPDLESAHISYSLVKAMANGQPLGPMILGLGQPAYVMTSATTVRGILNMTAFTIMEAGATHSKNKKQQQAI